MEREAKYLLGPMIVYLDQSVESEMENRRVLIDVVCCLECLEMFQNLLFFIELEAFNNFLGVWQMVDDEHIHHTCRE